MSLVEAENVSYTYEDGTVALRNVFLRIEKRERVAILGPNGAGKSTLLHLLAGLKSPSKGSIRLFGTELKNAKRLRLRAGILFQDPDDQLFMPRVWDDIAFGPINQGLNEEEVKRSVRWAMEATSLKGFENRVPHHLSYGEKKRVAIAGVLAMKPELLLLDEPTANLDSRGRSELLNLINKLNKTVIVATHDINAALLLADRAYILNRKIIGKGELSELFSDRELLDRAGLEQPDIAKLFAELSQLGHRFEKMPLTVDDAVRILSQRMV